MNFFFSEEKKKIGVFEKKREENTSRFLSQKEGKILPLSLIRDDDDDGFLLRRLRLLYHENEQFVLFFAEAFFSSSSLSQM